MNTIHTNSLGELSLGDRLFLFGEEYQIAAILDSDTIRVETEDQDYCNFVNYPCRTEILSRADLESLNA